MGELALAEYAHWSAEDVRKVAEKFHDHWLSVGGVKKDWEATWRNWCRNESRAWTALPRAAPARGFESEKDKARRAVAEAISGKGAGNYGRIIDIGSGTVVGADPVGLKNCLAECKRATAIAFWTCFPMQKWTM